jgi:hypothetical protein
VYENGNELADVYARGAEPHGEIQAIGRRSVILSLVLGGVGPAGGASEPCGVRVYRAQAAFRLDLCAHLCRDVDRETGCAPADGRTRDAAVRRHANHGGRGARIQREARDIQLSQIDFRPRCTHFAFDLQWQRRAEGEIDTGWSARLCALAPYSKPL